MNSILNLVLKCPKRRDLLCLSPRYIAHYNFIDSIENLMIKQSKVVNPDWGSIRKEALEIDERRVNQSNVDYLLLSQCKDSHTYKVGIEYANYLKKQGQGLNLASIGRLLKIYGSVQRQKEEDKSIKSIDVEAEILKLYNQLIEKHKVLDANLSESIIYALSTTKQWKECLNLVKSLEKHAVPTGKTYDSIISALFLHAEEEPAWKLLQEMIDKEKQPGDCTFLSYISYLDSVKDSKQFLEKSERLFNFWSTNDIIISEVIASKLIKLFETRKKRVSITTISVKGDCPRCRTRLPETIITDDDFNQLKSAFFDRVIIGKDVFCKTSPDELAAFNRFLKDKHHYDVIIDGLNVAYSVGVKKPVHVTSGVVSSVVEHYARQNKSVLVLGRNHMKKWPHIERIKNYSRLFLTQNLSEDDPYLLYCALNSGRGTIIVSRDMMRGHLYLLKEPHLKLLFRRWLSISRHHLLTQRKDGKLIINQPPTFIHSAQKEGNVWHLPILDSKRADEPKSIYVQKSEPTLWLCIQL